MSFQAQESRVDFLIRFVGIIVLGIGAAMVYLTNANTASISYAVATINYALGVLLIVAGVLAVYSKFK